MINILKFIRGYLRIKVWGFSPERFLNLCSNKNILLWDIIKDEEVYYMCISLSGFRKLRAITRKTKTRVVILKRFGLPFLIPKIFEKKVFLAGLIAACCFWFVTSLYVWEITLEGNLRITEDIFLDFLDEQDIRVGTKISGLDIEELEKEIRREFPEIIWVSAKISGTNLIISVKENDVLLTTEKDETPSNLYADKDGVIISMIVRSGVPQVKIGDRVEAGTLLVSGAVPVYNEDGTVRNYQYTRSDADIYVERIQDVYQVLPFDYIRKDYTGREEKKYFLNIFGKELTIGGEGNYSYYDVVGDTKEITLLKGLTLPFSFGTRTYREYQNVESTYTLEEAKTLLAAQLADFLEKLKEKGVQILENHVRMDSGSEGWILQGELTVKEKLGAEMPLQPFGASEEE